MKSHEKAALIEKHGLAPLIEAKREKMTPADLERFTSTLLDAASRTVHVSAMTPEERKAEAKRRGFDKA